MAPLTRRARSCRDPVETEITERCGGHPSRVRSGPKGRWSQESPTGRFAGSHRSTRGARLCRISAPTVTSDLIRTVTCPAAMTQQAVELVVRG
eukprot:7707364-Lingulodinium_polyedra.AAC.1